MKNIVLDLMMGILCILCIISFVGLLVLSDVLDAWKDLRK